MSKPAEQLREVVDLSTGAEEAGKQTGRSNRIGLLSVALLGIIFVISPEIIGNAFTSMLDKVKPIVVDIFLMGNVGVSIILSVMVGRALERMGFTDALIRLFVPLANRMKINPAVVIPGVYNILGDINAAGRIGGPIMKQAGATRDEQCIAIATMVQSQQSFSCFMLGLIALSLAGINAFPVVLCAVFVPLIIVPFVLSRTIYRNTRAVALKDLPSFTPQTPPFQTIFQGAREGAELLFLLVIPAIAVIYSLIGLLDYAGVWKPFEQSLSGFLSLVGVHPETGITAIMASPTLAMGQLQEIAASIDPRLVVGAFVLAASGLPLSDVLGQIPAIWSTNSDVTAREALTAAIIGIIMRFITVAIIAFGLTPLLV